MSGVTTVEQAAGLFFDIPNDTYHAGPGVSSTGLRLLGRSPAHYFGAYRDPKRPARTVKAGQLEGSLCHAAFLEPMEFDKRYRVGPPVNKNTNEWKNFKANLPKGVAAIDAEQREAAFAQAASLMRNSRIAELMSRGRPEVSAFHYEPIVVDEETGEAQRVLVRVRPDWVYQVNDKQVILLDAKGCPDASPPEFAKQVGRKGYDLQNAMYADVYEKASGQEVLGFVFAEVETEYPFVCSASMLDARDVEAGLNEYHRLLAIYAKCERENHWPGYTEDVALIQVPTSARRRA
jgi:hypothetical protein